MTAKRSIGQFSVFPIGLGAMPFSMGANVKPPRQQAIETVHAALASGVELIDTADIYAPSWNEMGHNELIVAEALRSYADDKSGVVVATKGGITRGEGESWGRNGSADYLRGAIERSLGNLGVDQIDLYYWHRPDRTIRYSETVEALASFKQEGLIREIGLSNANVEELELARQVLGDGGLAAVQNEFSPKFHHTSKAELDWCAANQVAFLPWSPLGGTGAPAATVGEKYPILAEVAGAYGVSPQQVTLAWELSLGQHVIPIPGASRPGSIQDSAQATQLRLTPDEISLLSKAILG